MKTRTIKTCLLIPAVALVAFTSQLAVAGTSPRPTVIEHGDKRSIAVSYADLNLSTEAGVQRLSRRIVRAARIVCDITSTTEMAESWGARKCYREAKTRAMGHVHLAVARVRGGEQLASLDRNVAISGSSR